MTIFRKKPPTFPACRCCFAVDRGLQILSRRIERVLGVVVGLQRLAIFVGRAFALTGQVEDHAQLDMAPNFGPARLAVAVERFAISICRRLIVVLQEENFGNAVVRQRAVSC